MISPIFGINMDSVLEQQNNFKEAWSRMMSAERVLLVSHLSPDVDAAASLGTMIELLRSNNKDYLAFAQGKDANQYFLPNEAEIIGDKERLFELASNFFNNGKELKEDFLSVFDVVVIMDCGSLERTALTEYFHNIKFLMLDTFVIEIDHHVPAQTYADIEIKIPLASTTEVLYHFIKANDLIISRSIANCLLAGILTDTANFLYPSVSSSTLDISSELLALGAQFPKLLNNTWRNKSFLEMKLWGLALANLRVNKKYNLAFSVLPYEDLAGFKEKYGDWGSDVFSDIVGFLSNLSEAEVILLLREEEVGKIKGSLRVGANDSGADVNKLASVFGGGGHKKAAGFAIEGSIVKDDGFFKIL